MSFINGNLKLNGLFAITSSNINTISGTISNNGTSFIIINPAITATYSNTRVQALQLNPRVIGQYAYTSLSAFTIGDVNTDTSIFSGSFSISTTALLRIHDSTYNSIILSAGSSYNTQIHGANSTRNAGIYGYSGLNLGGSNDTIHMLISSTGSVGIGVTTPLTRLQVSPRSQYSAINTGDGLLIYNPTLTAANIMLGVNGNKPNVIQSRNSLSSDWDLHLNPYGGDVLIGYNDLGAYHKFTDRSYQAAGFGIDNGYAGSGYGAIGFNIAFSATTSGVYYHRRNDYMSGIYFGSGGINFFTAPVALGGVTASYSTYLYMNNTGSLLLTGSYFTVSGISYFKNNMLFGSNGEIGTITWGGSGFTLYSGANQALSLGSNNTINRLVIATNGNVGIGTVSPLAKLHISGSLSTANNRLLLDNTEGGSVALYAGITSVSNAGFSILTGGVGGSGLTEKFVISSVGNIGIGTTNPTLGKVQIVGTSVYALHITQGGSLSTNGIILNHNTSGNIRIYNENTSRAIIGRGTLANLVLYDTGNVSIGSVSDFARLYVISSGTTSGSAFLVANSTSTKLLTVRDDGAVIYGVGAMIYSSEVGSGALNPAGQGLSFRSNDGSSLGRSFLFKDLGALVTTSGGRSIIEMTDNIFPTSGSANFNALNIGFVINQTGGANGIIRGIYYNPSITNIIGSHRAIETTSGNVIFNGGNVGIGTTSPITPLHIYRDNTTSRTSVIDIISIESEANGVGGIGYDGFGTGIVFRGSTYMNPSINRPLSRISSTQRDTSLNDYGNAIVFETIALSSGTASPVERFRIEYNGNIGVGTTAPSYKLDVVSGATISARFDGRVIGSNAVNTNEFVTLGQLSTGASSSYFLQNGNSFGVTASLGTTDNKAIQLKTNNVNRLTILTNGYSGIGTFSNPSDTLTVWGNIGIRSQLAAGNGSTVSMWFSPTIDGGGSVIHVVSNFGSTTATQYSSGFKFVTANYDGSYYSVDALSILAKGYVGIGTTNPTVTLDVVGTINISTSSYFRIGSQAALYRGSDNMLQIGSANNNHTITLYGGTVQQMYIHNTGVSFSTTPTVGTYGIWHRGNQGAGSLLDSDTVDGNHANSFVSSAVATSILSNSIFIPDTRSVGSTSSAYTTRGIYFDFKSNSTVGLTYGTSNYNGLITIAPWNDDSGGGNHQLAFADTAFYYRSGTRAANFGTWYEVLTSNSSIISTLFKQNGNSFGATATLGTNDNYGLQFETNNNARMFISATGNVGIGTLSPTSKFQIGDGNTPIQMRLFSGGNIVSIRIDNGMRYWDIQNNGIGLFFTDVTGGIIPLYLKNGGNIGIGTTNPIYRLDVVSGTSISTRFDGRVIGATAINNDEFITLGQLASSASNYFSQNGNSFGATAVLGTNDGYGLQLETNGTTRLTIGTNGYVGIGLNSMTASYRLHVIDNNTSFPAQFEGAGSSIVNIGSNSKTGQSTIQYTNTYGNAWVGLDGVGDPTPGAYRIYTNGTNPIIFLAGVTEKMRIHGNGNVTIGTTASPTAKLDVRINDASSNTTSYLNLLNDASGYVGYTFKKVGSNDLGLYGNYTNNPYMSWKYVNNSISYVGINTATPSTMLHIVGSQSSPLVFIDAKGAALKVQGANMPPYDQIIAEFVYGGNNNTLNVQNMAGQASLVSSQNLNFKHGTTTSVTRFYSAIGVELMRLSDSGSLGIGTTSPTASAKLDIEGNIRISGQIASTTNQIVISNNFSGSWGAIAAAGLNIGDWSTVPSYGQIRIGDYNFQVLKTNSTSLLTVINTTGNTGIGTDTPSYKLDVISGAAIAARFDGRVIGVNAVNSTEFVTLGQLSASASNYFIQNGNSFGATAVLGTNDNYGLQFETNNTTVLTISTNSYVGIGTTTPTASLHIKGIGTNSNTNALLLQNTNNQIFKINNNGDISFKNNVVRLQYFTGTDVPFINKITIGDYDYGYDPAPKSYLHIFSAYSMDSSANTNGVSITANFSGIGTKYYFTANGVAIGNNAGVAIGYNSSISNSGYYGHTGCDIYDFRSTSNFVATMSNSLYTSIIISPQYEVSQQYSGILRGLYYSPTIVSITSSHVAIETTSGDIIFNGGNILFKYLTASTTDLLIIGATGSVGRTSSSVFLAGNYFAQNGNSFGATAVLGTNDNYGLQFEVNNTRYITIATNGKVGIGSSNTTPIYNLDVSGGIVGAANFSVPSYNTILANNYLMLYGGNGGGISADSTGNLSFGNFVSSTLNTTMYLDNTGKLGIGTTNPSEKLHIQGNLYISGSLLIAGTTTQINTTNLSVSDAIIELAIGQVGVSPTLDSGLIINRGLGGSGSSANVGFIWKEDSDEFVLIGTGNTASVISITVSNYENLRLRNLYASASNISNNLTLNYLAGTSSDILLISTTGSVGKTTSNVFLSGNYFAQNGNSFGITASLGTIDNKSLVLKTNNTDVLTILNNGDIRTSLDRMRWYEQVGKLGFGITAGQTIVGKIQIEGGDAGNGFMLTRNGVTVSFSASPALAGIFMSSNNPLLFTTNAIERVRISETGNVGIGITPAFKLHVCESGESYVAQFEGSSTSVINIGKASLSGGSYIKFMNTSCESWVGLDGSGDTAPGSFNIYTSGSNPIIFKAGVTEKMRILSSGNVGIGIINPIEKLHINGNLRVGTNSGIVGYSSTGNKFGIINISDQYGNMHLNAAQNYGLYMDSPEFYFRNASAIIRMYINPTGNIGIGTTSQIYKLDVVSGATISARFDGRVIGVTAINSNEFTTLGQLPNYGNVTNRNTFLITDWNQTTYQNTHFLSSESGATNSPTTDFTYGMQLSFHRSGAAYRTQLVSSLYGTNELWVRNSKDSDVWSSWTRIVTNSGTWNIGITGFANGVTFSNITSKPTTLAGYGITDNVVYSTASYANPTWITSLAGTKITGVVGTATFATTASALTSMLISQFTNNSGYLTTQTSHADVVVDGDFTSQGIMLRGGSSGVYSILTDNSSNWNTAFGWGDHTAANYTSNTRTLTINGIIYDLTTDRTWSVGDLVSSSSYANPTWITSLAGTKITGNVGTASYATVALNSTFANGVTWSNITSKPTTIAGYGITDAFVRDGNSFGNKAVLGTNDTQLLSFKTNNLDRITIAATATRMGIGTTSPLYTLDVVSADSIASKFNGRIIGVTAINSNELTTLGQIRYVVVEKSDNVLYTDVTNVSQTYNLMLSSISSGTTHSNVFHANSITYNPFTGVLTVPSISATSYLGLTGGGGGSTNSFNQNGNTFGVTASIGTIDNKALNFITNNTVKMTIDTTGFIGIGNTNPSYSLDIRGNLRVGGLTASDNFIKIGAGRSSNGYAYIDLVGDTTYNGISAAAGFRIIRSNNGANAATDLQHAGTGNFIITNLHAADMIFKINNTEKVKINSTGITIQSDDSFQSTGTLNIKTNANNPIVMKINGTETTRFDENGILVTSTTPPSTNPASGTMYIYLDSNGYLKARGSNGTITTLATP